MTNPPVFIYGKWLCSGSVIFPVTFNKSSGKSWQDKVASLREWMGDSAKVTIVTALDEVACKYLSSHADFDLYSICRPNSTTHADIAF